MFFNIIAFLSFTLTRKQKEQRLKGKRKEGAGVVIKEVKNIAVWFSLGERKVRILCSFTSCRLRRSRNGLEQDDDLKAAG